MVKRNNIFRWDRIAHGKAEVDGEATIFRVKFSLKDFLQD